jgi:hypothetical protein
MKYEIKMKNKDTNEVVNNSIQDLADVQACEDFILNNPLTFQDYDTEIVPYVDPIDPISPRQLRLALLSLGKTESDIETIINSLASPVKEQVMIAWKYSTSFDRTVPMVEAIGALLGYDADALNNIWISAKDL